MIANSSSFPYMLIGGDLSPTGEIAKIMYSKDNMFDKKIASEVEGAFFFAVNLESPITFSEDKPYKSGPSLKGNPSIIEKIKKMGIDALFLANNHIMDYGVKGLNDTINFCKQVGISTFGAGNNHKEASLPLIINHQEIKIGMLSIAEEEFGIASIDTPGCFPLECIDNIKQIRDLKKKCDVIILSIHGGLEHFPLPRPKLRQMCQFFIDEGVDAIVCHHTHIASAYELYQNKPIFYGVGNFLFENKHPNQEWEEGFLVKLFFDPLAKNIAGFDIIPYTQSVRSGGLNALIEQKFKEFIDKIDSLNAVLADKQNYRKQWLNFCKQQETEYLVLMYFPFLYRPVSILKRIPYLKNILTPMYRAAVRLNVIRCPSHAEVFREIHEQRMNN